MEVSPKAAVGVIAVVMLLCVAVGYFFMRENNSIPPAQRAMFEAAAKQSALARKGGQPKGQPKKDD